MEDEPSLRVLAAESLRKLGYTVLQAGNGLEAIAVADGHAGHINIVVTDVVMPRLGGPELVARLREKRDGFSVIFMSGYTEAGALENSKIGPDAVLLNKPFSTEVLARKIKKYSRMDPMVSESGSQQQPPQPLLRRRAKLVLTPLGPSMPLAICMRPLCPACGNYKPCSPRKGG